MKEQNQHKERKLSEMDKLYQEIYGEKFAKAGTAYERLATVAIALIMEEPALYNQFIEGYSGVTEQLDGEIQTSTGNIQVEAKDYSEPVGYEHIAKLEGTLTDNEMKSGILAAPSGFTDPTKKYAEGTLTNPHQKKITLYDVRKSTEEDRKGRIETININYNIVYPDFTPKCLSVVWTDEGKKQFKEDILSRLPQKGRKNLECEEIYDKDRNIIKTIHQISIELNKFVDMEDETQTSIEGFYPQQDSYLLINNKLYPINGFKYKVPILRFTITEEIHGGEPVLLVRSNDGNYDKLITKEELQKFSFDNGKIIKKD